MPNDASAPPLQPPFHEGSITIQYRYREEDREYGSDKRGDELPEELQRRESRLKKIREAKKRLEERQADEDRAKGRHEGDGGRPEGKKGQPFKNEFGQPAEKAQDNFTDPESRIMKMGNGFEQSYNAQACVDEANQIIVAVGVTNCAADNTQLIPMIEATEAVVDQVPEQVLADAEPRIVVTDQGGQVVMMPLDDFNSWKETLYLLSNPANAAHLRRSIAEAEAGKATQRELIGRRPVTAADRTPRVCSEYFGL